MKIEGLPKVTKFSNSGNISYGINGLPSNREFFAGGGGWGHGGGHGQINHGGLRPGGRGLGGYGRSYSLDYNPYNPYPYQPVAYIQQITPTCGGSNCNIIKNNSTNRYESSPGTQCTCCDFGKTCRMNPPEGVKYNDCCSGLECKNGYCNY